MIRICIWLRPQEQNLSRLRYQDFSSDMLASGGIPTGDYLVVELSNPSIRSSGLFLIKTGNVTSLCKR